jgi:TRAP-type C4-dicarboxylate transport system substrate-binding protein
MKTPQRIILLLAVMVFSLAAVCSSAIAQQKHVLKFNHVLGPSEPYHLGFQKWAKSVDEKTKGGLKIEVFHSAQLGVEEDIIEQIRRGANIGQNTDSARMGNYVPGIAVMNGPYFAENLDEVAKLTKSPIVKGWLDDLANKYGLKILSAFFHQ